jgi:hypothetical protein
LNQSVEIALVGTGNRSQTIYKPLFGAMEPWVRLVAVCDPVRENADDFARSMGVPAFYSLEDLVKARPMEAALVVAPIPVHHAISCYLSEHGIHNHIETSMASTLAQAQEMVDTARRNDVVMRIGENFFRFPFDRIARKVAETGFLGPVKRLTCFQDHTGYHNNSRWILFYRSRPAFVQAIEHKMPTAPHYQAPHRFHESENFQARFFCFDKDRLVVDMAGNIKGMLGRYPRPGYTEIAGARGTIVQQTSVFKYVGESEVRYCSDHALQNGGVADEVFPIVHVEEDNRWLSSYVDLPSGRVEHVNPFSQVKSTQDSRGYYSSCIVEHVADFARVVRGEAQSEYTDEDALTAMMMEVGAQESALRDGECLRFPLEGDLESEEKIRQAYKEKYRADPLDIEAMLGIKYKRP